MESIVIKNIDKKDSGLVIVKYASDKGNNLEATLNTKWQSQEVDYLEKDVGIGGQCNVTIEQKGKYINITKVFMDSAVKGNVNQAPKPSRENSIIAQCLTKACINQGDSKNVITIDEAVKIYKEALRLLDE